MKKVLYVLAIVMAMVCCFSSCTKKKAAFTQTVSTLNVEQCVNTDKEWMFLNYGEDFRFYECQCLLAEYLNEDPTGNVVEITNVFQAISPTSKDINVIMFTHNIDGYYNINVVESFWIEDFNLTDVKLNYLQAFTKVMATNSPKPHSRHAVLRNPIGPVAINPQWVFGNIHSQLWVDAVTGEVRDSNPAFPEEQGFKMPLGEWP